CAPTARPTCRHTRSVPRTSGVPSLMRVTRQPPSSRTDIPPSSPPFDSRVTRAPIIHARGTAFPLTKGKDDETRLDLSRARRRPRRFEQAVGRSSRALSTLRLPRHGRGAVPTVDGGARRQSPAARDGYFDGRDADVALGRDLPGVYGRADAARESAHRDCGPE